MVGWESTGSKRTCEGRGRDCQSTSSMPWPITGQAARVSTVSSSIHLLFCPCSRYHGSQLPTAFSLGLALHLRWVRPVRLAPYPACASAGNASLHCAHGWVPVVADCNPLIPSVLPEQKPAHPSDGAALLTPEALQPLLVVLGPGFDIWQGPERGDALGVDVRV